MKNLNLWNLPELKKGDHVGYVDSDGIARSSLITETWKEHDKVLVLELETNVEVRISITPFKED